MSEHDKHNVCDFMDGSQWCNDCDKEITPPTITRLERELAAMTRQRDEYRLCYESELDVCLKHCPELAAMRSERDALRDAINILHDIVEGKRFDDANVAEIINGAMKIGVEK